MRRIGELGLVPTRCVEGPADNYYHGAWYDVPPALYRGYAYRPYYRYTAYRAIPRNYFCTQRWLRQKLSYPAKAGYPVHRGFSDLSLTPLEYWIARLRGR